MRRNFTPIPITERRRYTPDPKKGLSTDLVLKRIEDNLTNKVAKKYSKSYFSIFVENICTFFNLLGLIVLVALIVVGADLSNFFFALIYFANLTIGIIQEIRAKKCIDKLSLVANKNTFVIRDGMEIEVSSTDVVLDDIILLRIGNQIPTDCKIVSGVVEVNEALITGESMPVKKHVGDDLLAGSFITSGHCRAQAMRVGKDNYVESLSAKAKKYKKPHSELMNSLKLIIKIIGIIIIPIATVYMIKSTVLQGVPIADAILRTSTVVLGMIPSGMFLLTNVALAVGIIKLFKHNTLVQDLYSLEMLARVDTICFDKTGTITDGRMSVKEVVPLQEEMNIPINDVISSMIGSINDNNQTAIALYNYFGQKITLRAKKTLPFNSIRKLSAVTFMGKGTYAFGAPEFVLSPQAYRSVKGYINQYAAMGLRVLILAHADGEIIGDKPPKDFIPVALILIVDNIREDAIETIEWFKKNNVAIKVISGDNPITVSEVAKRVNIPNADKYISLEGLSDNEVFNIANQYTVFGRVSPEQKAILIKAIKSAGHVTAMTGDGVNDILALKEADCAISVAAGSDAARNIAHLVLMDNNFSSMPKIVKEGRRVINNVQSSASLFLMKTLFTMIVAIVTLIIPVITSYPFTPKQMILLEMFIIGLPSFFLSLQPNDARVEGTFMNFVLRKSIPSAILMAISVGIVFGAQALFGEPIFSNETYYSMGVFALTYAGLISLYNICKPLNVYRGILFFSTLTILLVITLLSIFYGFGMLGITPFVPLDEYWHHILIVVAIVLFDITIASILQRMFANVKFVRIKRKKDVTHEI